jgi:hypothetical protein
VVALAPPRGPPSGGATAFASSSLEESLEPVEEQVKPEFEVEGAIAANWLRNVLAAGSATLVTEGRSHEVDRPELVPMGEVVDHFPPGDQRSFRIFGVDRALRLRQRAEVAI